MSSEAGRLIKFKNISKETLRFSCGSDRKQFGFVTVMDTGMLTRKPHFKAVERIYTVKPGETVDLEEGYTVPRDGIIPRGSYLQEAGLIGRLAPVEEKPDRAI